VGILFIYVWSVVTTQFSQLTFEGTEIVAV